MNPQDTILKDGMYFSVHIVKEGKLYSTPLRDLPTMAASITEMMAQIAVNGQEAVDSALKTLNN